MKMTKINKSLITNLLIIFGLIISIQVVFNTSYTLKPWEDELISLTSSSNFFKNLNFLPSNSYGNYSYGLTSGILSAVGGVIGWNITQSFVVSRIANFLYICLLQIFMVFYIFKDNKKFNIGIVFFFGFVSILLVPWWFSTLYLIAEIVSTLVFVNALFIYDKNKKLSLFLIGSSVIFGKFLMIIPSVLFLISKFDFNNLKKSFTNLVFFIIPFLVWYILIYFKIGTEDFLYYLNNFFGTLVNREDSGVQSALNFSYNTIYENLQKSEVSSWTPASVIRAALTPLIFLFIYYKNKTLFLKEFRVSFTSMLFAIMGTYAWFWVLTPFKYIRQSTHFVLIVIFTSLYIFLFSSGVSKFYKFLLLANISFFLSDLKIVIAFNLVLFLYFILKVKQKAVFNPEVVVIFFLILNLINMNLELREKDKYNLEFNSCELDLFSPECVKEYLLDSYN